MAFITLRRSRSTRSYYLVESYRDEAGRSRKRTLCYLGRQRDGTDTLEKAIRHWERVRDDPWRLRSVRAGAAGKVKLLKSLVRTHGKKQWARSAEEAPLWTAIRRLRRRPTQANAAEARRAYRFLSRRHHPGRGGDPMTFVRLEEEYRRALDAMR
jgi:hypothetical protein